MEANETKGNEMNIIITTAGQGNAKHISCEREGQALWTLCGLGEFGGNLAGSVRRPSKVRKSTATEATCKRCINNAKGI